MSAQWKTVPQVFLHLNFTIKNNTIKTKKKIILHILYKKLWKLRCNACFTFLLDKGERIRSL
jgi:hypothetical protein